MRLTGNRVVLRLPEEHEYELLWQMIYGEANPEWKKWDAPYFPLEQVGVDAFTASMKRRTAQPVPSFALVEIDGKVIGDVTYYWEHEPSRWLEVGIVILQPQYWSGGIGTEALQLWISHLFGKLTLARIGLTTWSGNHRMIRCAEKLGMQMEGRMRKCRYYNGEYYDSIRMGVLREEWEAKYTQ